MAEWRRHGLLGLTLNLQGGSPQGYSQDQPWHNSAFSPDGSLRPQYMRRLERILDRADMLGMVAIVGLFYFGQDQRLENDAAVRRAVREATLWLSRKEYRHVLIEIANECDNAKYDQPLIKPARVAELIELARSVTHNGWQLSRQRQLQRRNDPVARGRREGRLSPPPRQRRGRSCTYLSNGRAVA